jgi:hypothetical protein
VKTRLVEGQFDHVEALCADERQEIPQFYVLGVDTFAGFNRAAVRRRSR